jgi:ADP-ribose pyrophosphatase YjhB (NUDIX family)
VTDEAPDPSRRYPSRPYLAASVAVVRDGRVLVARRTRPPAAALYSLPGGLVEPGETLDQAALRELREETGVEAETLGLLGPVEVIDRDGDGRVRHHFVVMAHAARWRAGEGSALTEADAVAWVDADEVDRLPTTDGLPALVRAALRRAGA